MTNSRIDYKRKRPLKVEATVYVISCLIIIEFVPHLEYNKKAFGGMDMEYLTSNEIAVKWDISSHRVRKLCGEGSVKGTVQKDNLWLIPEIALKPDDFQRRRKKQDNAMR